jgi:MazG family protein
MQKIIPDDPVEKLLRIMSILRSVDGCPWDKEQTPETLRPYLLEETYEVLAAMDLGDPDDVRQELGDLLLQIVFLSDIYAERGTFNFSDVADSISNKLIRRHPHVFGDSNEKNLEKLNQQWEAIKQSEMKKKPESLIANVPAGLPALMQAQKISEKVARAGFEWESCSDVVAKLDEEVSEIKDAINSGNKQAIEDEFGDILFTLVNIGRHLEIDAETSLLIMLERFKARFRLMEEMLSDDNKEITNAGLDVLETYWCRAKEILQGN